MTRLEQLQKLAQVSPDEPMSHYGLGLEYMNLQQFEQAAAAFGRAIEVDPKYSAAYYHKARAEMNAGDSQRARTTLEAGLGQARAQGDWHTVNEMQELLDTLE